jgi:hypothetical protein
MPHTFYLIRVKITALVGLTYPIYIYKNQQVVVLQINSVRWSNRSSHRLDDLVSAERVVVSNCWADSILGYPCVSLANTFTCDKSPRGVSIREGPTRPHRL